MQFFAIICRYVSTIGSMHSQTSKNEPCRTSRQWRSEYGYHLLKRDMTSQVNLLDSDGFRKRFSSEATSMIDLETAFS